MQWHELAMRASVDLIHKLCRQAVPLKKSIRPACAMAVHRMLALMLCMHGTNAAECCTSC